MNKDFSRLVVRLAVALMKSDGAVDGAEVEALKHQDELGLGRISHLVAQEMDRAEREPIDLEATCNALKTLAPHGGPVILAALGAIAASNREVPVRELWALRTISRLLGVPDDVADEAFGPALAVYEASDRPSRPAKGPAPARTAASKEDVIAAYRDAIERYSPERAMELGPEFAALAVRRLARATAEFEAAMKTLEARAA